MFDQDPILAGLNDGELKELRAIAARSSGLGGKCTLEAAAVALLKSRLMLERDCGNVLPNVPITAHMPRPVTLGNGIKK